MIHVCNKKHPLRRAVWFIVAFSALAFSTQKVYETTVNYFKNPFFTARARIYVNHHNFPAVSFCNLNDMRFSILNGTRLDSQILNPEKKYNLTAEEYLPVKKSAHKIEEMLISCEFDGVRCSSENFTSFYHKQGEKCYTFNGAINKHDVRNISGVGEKRSLKLIIDIQHRDYYRDVMNAGIHLIVHDSLETPVKKIGSRIPPGFCTRVRLKKKKV